MKKEKNKFDFAVGGQAVIEGVMMRSLHFITIAVRKPNGEILVREDQFTPFAKRLHVLKIPILRGMIGLIEALYLGTKALNFSSKVAMEEKDPKSVLKTEKAKAKNFKDAVLDFLTFIFTILTYLISIALALFLFKFLPLSLAEFSSKYFGMLDNGILFNLIDGVIKILLFVLYLFAISLIPDIKRVFQYHGAEHKSIMTYEHNLSLNVENALTQRRFHPRCGTSFIFFVFFLSIFIYTVLPTHNDFILKLIERILFLPIIAGVSYEVLKLSAKYQNNFLIKLFIQPGLALQRITTQEPDEKEMELGLASLKRALELEKSFKE
jgi:uncharacterized protein YqhQ